MNFFGAYHVDIRPQAMGICDAPQISKGQMTISGFETASSAGGMALTCGRLRNRAALAKMLNCTPYCSQAQLALRAYEEWGDDFAGRLEGPCMCCIADVQRDRMLLSNDRMGENLLFYAHRQGAMVFADHPDMILKSAFLEPVMGKEELCEVFGLGPARTPGKTPVRGMLSLPAGSMLICENGNFKIKRYFELSVCEHDACEADTIEHTRHLLVQCVDDVVPLHPACMLSGGIDSTALTALLSMRIGRLESYSVDYRGNDGDFVANAFRPERDAPYIQMAARAFSTRHHNILLEQENLVEALESAMRARGFPGMADIDSSLLLFAREIVRSTPNVVSGECGDEVFGGYPWFREDALLSEDCFPWSGSMDVREYVLKPEIREKLGMRAYVRNRMQESLDSYDVSAAEASDRHLFRLQRLCFDYFMPNLQERAAQMCAFSGLNVLTPLCDDRLVQFVYNVPWKMKRMGGMEKGLFREAMRDLMPEKLRLRKKSPYPKTCSAAYTSLVRGRMRALAADCDAPLWQIADKEAVERIAASAMNPADMPWFGQLMAGPQLLAYLLQINAWMKERGISVCLE